MDAKLVLLTSKDCETCAEMKKNIERTGREADIIVVDGEGGKERMSELKEQGLVLTSDDVPQCFYDYGEGSFAPCDAEALFEELKEPKTDETGE